MNTENKFEGLYIIGYGLSGSFGGQRNFEVIQVNSQEEAEEWAYNSCCDEYNRYLGMYGLREIGEIMEEENVDEDEAVLIFDQERERWLSYSAQPYSKEYEKKVMYHHYHNPYKEITD